MINDALRFVVADVGRALEWIPTNQRYEFWKNEVQPQLATGENARLEDFPDNYCYSEWKSYLGETIILVEKAH